MIIDTINDLIQASIPLDNYARVLGYHNPGDNGGGDFVWITQAPLPAVNGVTVIDSTSGISGVWVRQFTGGINVNWAGANGDGVTDDTDAINDAVSAAANSSDVKGVIFSAGNYKVSGTVNGDGSTF